jgi:hypothetical protein
MEPGKYLPIDGSRSRVAGSSEGHRSPPFRLFLASWGLGELGYSIYSVVAIWLAYQLSGSALGAGAVIFLEYAAYSLIPLVGPVIDRMIDGRRILLLCYPLQAVVTVGLGVAAVTGHLSIPLVLVGVAVISFLWNFVWTTNSIAPALMMPPSGLFRAQSRSQIVGAGASLAGFAVGAATVAIGEPVLGIFLYGIFLGAATLPVLGFSLPLGVRSSTGSLVRDLRDGWRLFLGKEHRGLFHLTLVDAVGALFAVAPLLLITVFAAASGHGSSGVYAVLFTAYVMGSGAAGIGFGRLTSGGRIGRYLVASLALAGALIVVSPIVATSWWLAAGLWFLVGAALEGYGAVFQVYLQGTIPPESRGRLVANAYLFSSVGSAVGALALSAAIVGGGTLVTATIAGVGLVLAGVLGWLLPGVRRISTAPAPALELSESFVRTD